MKTSCRFAMAVQVLAVLAFHEGDRVTSACLAESVNTNPVVIRRLLLALQKGRLVETCKGVGAGSRLSRAPRRINLAEVYRAVEEVASFGTRARQPNAACPVGHYIHQTLAPLFASAERALEQDLAKTSLADILTALRNSGACARHPAP